MTDCWAKLKRIRLVFGKTDPLLKTVIAAAIVLSTMTLVTIRMVQWDVENSMRQLQEQAAALEAENHRLQEKIDMQGTAEGIRLIASEELGLVDPSTIIIDSE